MARIGLGGAGLRTGRQRSGGRRGHRVRDDFHDCAWLPADAVKELDAKHADWNDRWIVDDGIQEVRTNMSLRTAKRVLLYVGSYRRFVIDYFAGEWEWNQPSAVLPIYLTANQADYQARLTDHGPAAARSRASAICVQKTGGLCPGFLTFAPKVAGAGTKIGWDALLRDVRHEVAHPLLYESSMARERASAVPSTGCPRASRLEEARHGDDHPQRVIRRLV